MMMGPVHASLGSEPTSPYSATEEFSLVQTLSDGTHITPKSPKSKIYRDSQGRTREERPFCGRAADDPGAMIVTIRDPVAGVAYILDLQDHIAHRFTAEAKTHSTGVSGTIGASVAGVSGSGVGSAVSGYGDPSVPSASPSHSSLSNGRPKPSRESEPLGTQVIEGLAAEGTRTTETIPIDTEDNDQPMKVVTETWYSVELKTTILRKTSDPRSGESTWHLIDVNLSEPDPALFQVPADFKITDDTGRVTIDYSR